MVFSNLERDARDRLRGLCKILDGAHSKRQDTRRPAEQLVDAMVTVAQQERAKAGDVPALWQRGDIALDANTDGSTVVVLQAEYGVVASPGSTADPAAARATPRARRIASIDATSCIVVALRGSLLLLPPNSGNIPAGPTVADADPPASPTQTFVVTLGHFDHGGETVLLGLASMVHACAHELRQLATDSMGEKATSDDPPVQGTLEVYIAGGCVNERYSLPMLSDVMLFFSRFRELVSLQRGDPPVAFQNNLHAVWSGWCFWTEVTSTENPEDPQCRLRGLVVDATDGSCSAIHVPPGHRGYAQQQLRHLRPFGNSSDLMTSISPLTVPEHRFLARAWQEQCDKAGKPDLRIQQVVFVRSFSWKPFPPQIVRLNRDEIMRMSTTPTMEPPDFAACTKGCVIFATVNKHTAVFEGCGERGAIVMVLPQQTEAEQGAPCAADVTCPWIRLPNYCLGAA